MTHDLVRIEGSRISRALAALVLIGGLCVIRTVAQTTAERRPSIVRIQCDVPLQSGGLSRLTSTGFLATHVDRQNYVVTSLHGVVGCQSLTVISEYTQPPANATVVKVSLEGDLALLRPNRDLGLPALQPLAAQPNSMEKFFIWGYPGAIERMFGRVLSFDLNPDPVLLGQAFPGISGFQSFFTGRTYPTQKTAVLRVDGRFYPSQSGSPVLDAAGRVVAIADGALSPALLDVSWAIPAYKYLIPLLQNTPSDAIPRTPTRLDMLVASSTPVQARAPIPIPANPLSAVTAAVGAPGATTFGQLRQVRRMALTDLEGYLRSTGDDTNFDFIRQISRPGQFQRLSFDTYLDARTGATLSVPSGLIATWNPQGGAIEARNTNNTIRMVISMVRARSALEVRLRYKQYFVAHMAMGVSWQESPTTFPYQNVNGDYANFAHYFSGVNQAGQLVRMNLSVTIAGSQMVAYALFGPPKIELLPTDDLIAYLMMQYALQSENLTAFPSS